MSLRQSLRRAGALAALVGLGVAPPLGSASAQTQLAGRPLPRAAMQPVAPPPTAQRMPYAPDAVPAPIDDSGRTVRVGTGSGASRTLAIPRGRSATVELPVDAGDVMVSDPKIADVVLSTPRRIQIMGLTPGQTDAQFVDGMGRRILHLDIRVDQDASAAGETISSLLPGTHVRVSSANGNLILSGEAANASEADRAVRLASSFVAEPNKVVNLINVAGGEQVMLKVKIVEVNRTVLKQLGFDLSAITGQLGMPQYSFLKSPTYGVNGSYLGSATGGYALNTTSQPVSTFPFSNLIPGLAQSASAAGIGVGNIASIVTKYLAGGTGLNDAQSAFSKQYLSGLLGNVSTQVTPNISDTLAGIPHTVTAASAGITTGNIASFDQAYLSGNTAALTPTVDPALTGAQLVAAQQAAARTAQDRIAFLNTFNNQLPSYNAAAANVADASSSYADRTNPANAVATGRAGSTGLNQANAMVQAFERAGLVRTLAEPTLTAVSGEAGHFLVGGEFPVPTSQDTAGRVSIEFKPYGVGLGYTPIVLSSGRISLKMSTEVSELTSVGGFTLSSGGGTSLSVPGLNVRRAETTVELPSGGAMMIAGLLQSQTKQTLDSLPGLMQLPVIGALLRSRDFQNNETELVIIVTPYLVKPGRPEDFATPADGLKIASDLETNLLGRLNTGFGKPPAATAGKTYQGPFGYVVE